MNRAQVFSFFRSRWFRKGLPIVSVLGLTIGIAYSVLTLLFALTEISVNGNFEKVDRLYRIDSEWRDPTMGIPITTLAPVGKTIVQEYPEAVNQVRIYLMNNTVRAEGRGIGYS